MRATVLFLVASLFLLGAPTGSQAKAFRAVPGAAGEGLAMRTVGYSGGTNGRMVIEVENGGTKRRQSAADGLYFVPAGDPEKAPQRLGAAGPFEVRRTRAGSAETVKAMWIEPGETVRLELH